jgi:hypothetical protein
MQGQHAIGLGGKPAEQFHALGTMPGKLGEERGAHGRGGIIQKLLDRLSLSSREFLRFHGRAAKVLPAAAQCGKFPRVERFCWSRRN